MTNERNSPWRERVEELLYRASALATSAAAAATSNFAGPVVPNEAAASALTTLVEGQLVRVLSTMDIYRFEANSSVPLSAHVVLASASPGASPRLFRTLVCDPVWRSGITDVYIDPSNVTGVANDENQAIFRAPQVGSARQPLLTWQELYRRWGRGNVITTGDLVNLTFQIHVLSSSPAATAAQDPCIMDFVCGVDTFPRMLGEGSTTVFGPIALTAATAANPAVPSPGGSAATIQVGATVWTPFVGKRIRRVSDGSIAYVLKDLGGGVARISIPALTNEPLFSGVPTSVAWSPGDTIVVEDLVNVHMGTVWSVAMEGSASGFLGIMNVANINIMRSNSSGDSPFTPSSTDPKYSFVFYQSTSDRGISLDSNFNGNNCAIRNNALLGQFLSSRGAFYGGAIINTSDVGGFAFVELGGVSANQITGAFDYSVQVQGGTIIVRGVSTIGSCAVWDTPITSNNPGGHAVLVGGSNSTAGAGFLSLQNSTPIWGTGAAGRGLRVQAGSKISQYRTLPNITGTTGDFQLANSTSAWFYQASVAAYGPPTGPIACSWANLAAAQPGGFGGSAHEPGQDSHINKEATT